MPYAEFKKYFIELEQIDTDELNSRSVLINLLSQQEHPITFKPFYFLHPCKTSEWMILTKVAEPSGSDCDILQIKNYTLKWLSFVFFSMNVEFDLKFGMP